MQQLRNVCKAKIWEDHWSGLATATTWVHRDRRKNALTVEYTATIQCFTSESHRNCQLWPLWRLKNLTEATSSFIMSNNTTIGMRSAGWSSRLPRCIRRSRCIPVDANPPKVSLDHKKWLMYHGKWSLRAAIMWLFVTTSSRISRGKEEGYFGDEMTAFGSWRWEKWRGDVIQIKYVVNALIWTTEIRGSLRSVERWWWLGTQERYKRRRFTTRSSG